MVRWLSSAIAWTATSPEMVQAVDAKIYRVRNWYLAVGAICTVAFIAFGISSVVAAYRNIDGSFPHPNAFALVSGAFWSCWVLLGLWIIGLYFRGRLFIASNWVRQRGCFLTRCVEFDDVSSARWRIWPQGGSLALRGRAGTLVVEFGNFSRRDRDELIEFFRSAFAEEIQEGWPKFDSLIADPRGEPEVAPEVRRADVIHRDYEFVVRSACLVWACYLLSLIPVSRDSIARGLLCGCFDGAMVYGPVVAVVAIIAVIRYRFARFFVLAAASVSLTILSWWHAIHWPVVGH